MAYKSAFYNKKNPFNNLSTLKLVSRIVTSNEEEIRTPKELSDWMINIFQENVIEIIYYDDLIPVSQLREGKFPFDDFETFKEKQPGIDSFKEKLSLEEWIGDEMYVNLTKWVKNFHLLQGLIINKHYEMEISKIMAVNLIELPKVNLRDNSYLGINKPTMKLKENVISNNVSTISNIKSFPFIRSDGL